ncbi:MAG: D-alanyl-D-alanine carboxypeptidase family protein [Bacilli bacterium]|nr:D-alanyl-D-alanine carboxypeptidase family protein [Bacilli bacterium]
MKKVLVMSMILLAGVVMTACGNGKDQNGGNKKYDYLVLVNKYSKLPDNWEKNVNLVSAKNAWGEDIKIEVETYKHYKRLAKDLKDDGVEIELDSVYRSVKQQQELWDRWSKDPEKGIDYAKKYAAVPGYSEHHTGLAVDIVIRKDGKLIEENEDMIAEREIFEKIHKKLANYGFILRYLEGRDDITGYTYEPWHLRYVGSAKVAKKIMNDDITFEEYLGSVKDIKGTPEAIKYQIEKTLQKYFKDVYGDKIINSRFNVTKIYSDKEVEENEMIKSLKIGKKDVPFEVTYELQPADENDVDELLIPNGEYDKKLGWIKDISRLGILKYNDKTDGYSIDSFGTGW